MSNFWTVDSKLAIAQRSVSVPSENGLAYTEHGKIVIKIDPSNLEYFLPSESYLQFRLKLKLGGAKKMKLQLNDRIGGHALINHVRILSGTGILLEEIQNYNVLAYLMYSYDTNDTKRRMRSLTERTTMYNPLLPGDEGGDQKDNNSTFNNPYFKDGKDLEFVYVKVCLPLVASGLFRNQKVFPTLMTQGLRLELTMEEAGRVVQRLCSAAPSFEGNVDSGTVTGMEHVPRLSHINSETVDSGYTKKNITLTAKAITPGTTTLIEFDASDDIAYLVDGTVATVDGFDGADKGDVNAKQFKLFKTATANTYEIKTNASPPAAVDTGGKVITLGTGVAVYQITPCSPASE